MWPSRSARGWPWYACGSGKTRPQPVRYGPLPLAEREGYKATASESACCHSPSLVRLPDAQDSLRPENAGHGGSFMKVLHVIARLDCHGAARQLGLLQPHLPRQAMATRVAVLSEE